MRVAENVGDPECRAFGENLLSVARCPLFEGMRRNRDAAAREDRICRNELLERHLGVAEGQADAVVVGGSVEITEARMAQKPKQRFRSDAREHHDRRNILRSGERRPHAKRTAKSAVVIARRINDARFGRRKMRRHIGNHCRWCETLLECHGVCKRLQRRSGLPRRRHSVDRAAEVLSKVIARSFPRQPAAAAIVEHGDRDAVRAVT